ncbi:hypothetical protein T265_08436 [Opisthorchis viverrini]|uniref:Uncharacterized protein n=1 Tax=Opisthorchis viverrini TaxID=6198 RepID=A0A074ZK65_OPIVI|nr:hypothetical protein T265_08435 [Opisthorchis viverrini]XP_009172501.1 hypothetical protein T265_08436 [Opisthorchis viverrini]KER23745.1 hypothetical protein T265_08435 [Opisthorchis viverrini]KER23746.1 hypothetical protein T265_08436 [Opisthorchis viverrini]
MTACGVAKCAVDRQMGISDFTEYRLGSDVWNLGRACQPTVSEIFKSKVDLNPSSPPRHNSRDLKLPH